MGDTERKEKEEEEEGETAERRREERREEEEEEEETGDGRRGGCLPTGSWQWAFPQRPKYKLPSAPWLSLAYGQRSLSYHPSHHIPSIALHTHKCSLPLQPMAEPGALRSPTHHIFHHLKKKKILPRTRKATVHPLRADSCSGGHRLIPLQKMPSTSLRYDRQTATILTL